MASEASAVTSLLRFARAECRARVAFAAIAWGEGGTEILRVTSGDAPEILPGDTLVELVRQVARDPEFGRRGVFLRTIHLPSPMTLAVAPVPGIGGPSLLGVVGDEPRGFGPGQLELLDRLATRVDRHVHALEALGVRRRNGVGTSPAPDAAPPESTVHQMAAQQPSAQVARPEPPVRSEPPLRPDPPEPPAAPVGPDPSGLAGSRQPERIREQLPPFPRPVAPFPEPSPTFLQTAPSLSRHPLSHQDAPDHRLAGTGGSAGIGGSAGGGGEGVTGLRPASTPPMDPRTPGMWWAASDSVTGLPGLGQFFSRAGRLLASEARASGAIAVVLVEVPDERTAPAAARALAAQLRFSDPLARLDRDLFAAAVLLFPGSIRGEAVEERLGSAVRSVLDWLAPVRTTHVLAEPGDRRDVDELVRLALAGLPGRRTRSSE